MSNWDLFQEAYQAAAPEIKAFVDSEEIGIFSNGLIAEIQIHEGMKPKLLIIISDVCLGIVTRENLGLELIQQGFPFESSHLIYTKIITFLSQKGLLEPPTTVITNPSSTSLSSEIKEDEQALNSLHTVRTMPQDVAAAGPARETVYQSSQADILARDQSGVPDVPMGAAAPPPRWGSEATK